MRTRYGQGLTIQVATCLTLAIVAGAIRFIFAPAFPLVGEWGLLFAACVVFAAAQAILSCAVFLLRFGILHGWSYFCLCLRILVPLRHALLDAGYSFRRNGLLGEYEELPKIRIERIDDGKAIRISVENSIRFDKRLEDVDISSAVRGFVLERAYLNDDRSEYMFEMVDASVNFHMTFESYSDFEGYVKANYDERHWFLDARSAPTLSSSLIVGQTGSGKSYLLYSLLLQLYIKKADLYVCDPKNSGLASLGMKICPEKTAVELDAIIVNIERFVISMEERKAQMQELLVGRLDATAYDFGLKPSVLFIDEYAAMAYALKTRDKKTRDRVSELIASVVLLGRQLGYVLVIAMQKSDATLIDTAMRENLPLIVVLGNAQPQTIVTAFGHGIDIPARHNKPGEGVFMEPHIAPMPKLLQAPELRFLAYGTDFL